MGKLSFITKKMIIMKEIFICIVGDVLRILLRYFPFRLTEINKTRTTIRLNKSKTKMPFSVNDPVLVTLILNNSFRGITEITFL